MVPELWLHKERVSTNETMEWLGFNLKERDDDREEEEKEKWR